MFSLGSGELNALEYEARDSGAAVQPRVVAHGDQVFPQLLVVPRDVHFGYGAGEGPLFYGGAEHSKGEVTCSGVGVATDEALDLIRLSKEIIPNADRIMVAGGRAMMIKER